MGLGSFLGCVVVAGGEEPVACVFVFGQVRARAVNRAVGPVCDATRKLRGDGPYRGLQPVSVVGRKCNQVVFIFARHGQGRLQELVAKASSGPGNPVLFKFLLVFSPPRQRLQPPEHFLRRIEPDGARWFKALVSSQRVFCNEMSGCSGGQSDGP